MTSHAETGTGCFEGLKFPSHRGVLLFQAVHSCLQACFRVLGSDEHCPVDGLCDDVHLRFSKVDSAAGIGFRVRQLLDEHLGNRQYGDQDGEADDNEHCEVKKSNDFEEGTPTGGEEKAGHLACARDEHREECVEEHFGEHREVDE